VGGSSVALGKTTVSVVSVVSGANNNSFKELLLQLDR
jgi:hypothetical protein